MRDSNPRTISVTPYRPIDVALLVIPTKPCRPDVMAPFSLGRHALVPLPCVAAVMAPGATCFSPDALQVTIIEAGWTQGPTFYVAKQRRFNDGPRFLRVANGPHSSPRAIWSDKDSWRDPMPFTSDPGAYSPSHLDPHPCGPVTDCMAHWPLLGERPGLRENECDGEGYQQCKEHLCSSVVIWHSRPLV